MVMYAVPEALKLGAVLKIQCTKLVKSALKYLVWRMVPRSQGSYCSWIKGLNMR